MYAELPADFAERARTLRERAGLSFLDVEWKMRSHRDELGPHVFSYGTVERIEKGRKREATCDTVFLALLAQIYNCDLEDLSPLAADRAGAILDALEPCTHAMTSTAA